jgi:hypothetical protein
METAAVQSGARPPVGLISKKALAVELGVSRPTLDEILKREQGFPVEQIGDQSGGYKFDLAKVRRWAKANPSALPRTAKVPKPAPPAVDQAQLRAVVAPALPSAEAHTPAQRRSAEHRGEASARQRMDEAKARKLEREEALAAGLVVPVADTQQRLATLVVQFASNLDALPEKIVAHFAGILTDAAVPGLRTMIDSVRVEMHRDAKSLFGKSPPLSDA